ncbi:MAG: hypothetical protein BGN86_15530 [Caulobacterales bacterium 68-7]|nr:MAG: hypothetical protein BGN86_15530 [Caulobacterales bacterium 68-7]
MQGQAVGHPPGIAQQSGERVPVQRQAARLRAGGQFGRKLRGGHPPLRQTPAERLDMAGRIPKQRARLRQDGDIATPVAGEELTEQRLGAGRRQGQGRGRRAPRSALEDLADHPSAGHVADRHRPPHQQPRGGGAAGQHPSVRRQRPHGRVQAFGRP